jgi:hypothetical protein
MSETRKCCKCKKIKEVSEFYTRIDRESGIRSMCKQCLLKFNKNYAADSEYFKKRDERRIKKHPWYRSYLCAKSRCKPKGTLFKRGLKFNLSFEDMGKLWFRDKADLLADPTIDRINNKMGYCFDNCRFIERAENSRKGAK